MFAAQFISSEIFSLKKSDDTESALMLLSDWMVKQLPVVENLKVLGFVNEKILLENEGKRVEELMLIDVEKYCVPEHMHLFEIWQRLVLNNFSTLAVVSSEGIFKGVISSQDIALNSFANSSLIQEGSILVLEIQAIHYSIAEIARICESNEAKIIHLMVTSLKDENNTLHVSLKMNKQHLSYVISSFERFGYKVIYTNSVSDSNQSLEDRFQWLIKYLNT